MKIHRCNAADPKFSSRFHYHGFIGKTKFLDNRTTPDIAYDTHQHAQLSEDPRTFHGTEVENLVKWLAATQNNEIILDPEKSKSWKFMRILILAETGINKYLPNTTAPKHSVQDMQLCVWDAL